MNSRTSAELTQLQEQLETQFEEKSELMSKLKATEKQVADLQVRIDFTNMRMFIRVL